MLCALWNRGEFRH